MLAGRTQPETAIAFRLAWEHRAMIAHYKTIIVPVDGAEGTGVLQPSPPVSSPPRSATDSSVPLVDARAQRQ